MHGENVSPGGVRDDQSRAAESDRGRGRGRVSFAAVVVVVDDPPDASRASAEDGGGDGLGREERDDVLSEPLEGSRLGGVGLVAHADALADRVGLERTLWGRGRGRRGGLRDERGVVEASVGGDVVVAVAARGAFAAL